MPHEIAVSLVSCPEVDRVWPAVASGFDRACRKTGGDTTVEYLWSECRSGAAFLVTVAEGGLIVGAGIFRFEYWTTGKRLRCLVVSGKNMKAWAPQLLAFARSFAAFGGARAIVSDGRNGFARVFPDAKVLRCLFELPLVDGKIDG